MQPPSEPIAFKLPRFYPILDSSVLQSRDCSPMVAAEALIASGARILQYRHKEEWAQSEFDMARQLAAVCHESGVLFVVNDRSDFARLIGAALHLGQQDLPPVAARRVISDEVMGFSTHNRLQLMRGNEEPVEYFSLGPIFATHSKERPDPVVGVEGLRQLRELTEKPLAAIGGITMLNASEVLAAGADSVAVISGWMPEKCDKKSLRRLTEEWIRLVAA